MPSTDLGYLTMKKMLFVFAGILAILSVFVFANSHSEECCEHNHNALVTNVSSKAKHCNGTVGCDCSGFAPITNGKEWQKAYCKRCGHHRNCHR